MSPQVGVADRMRRLAGRRSRPAARRLANALLARQLGSIDGVDTAQNLVALTFDDGPDPYWTPRVLDVLAEQGAKGTFFVLLDRVRERPDLVQRAAAEGHEVGLHGADHRRLSQMSRPEVRSLLAQARGELEAVISAPVTLFRPPFGAQTVRSYLAARDAGLECVVWAACGWDWLDISEEDVACRILDTTGRGDVVLLHDGMDMSGAEAPPSRDRARVAALVLDGLGGRGLRSETLTMLRRQGRDRRTAWFRQ